MPRSRTGRGGLLQIGQVAERTGLSLRTIRFYEENGLVVPSGRTDGGFRLYSDDDVARFAVIKQMKPLGFTLEEMGDLLDLLAGLRDHPHDEQRLDRLRMFHEAALARVTSLREQLDIAEGLATRLGRQLTTDG